MGRVGQSLTRIDNAAKSTHLSTGRLGNQFSNLAGRIAGVNPIVGNLANILGDFAVGGLVTVGVLAGLTAIAVAYEKLTSASRAAMKASDDLVASYLKQARVLALGIGGQQKADIEDIQKGAGEHAKRAGFLVAAGTMFPFLRGTEKSDFKAMGKAVDATQAAVNQLGLAVAAANDKAAPKVKALTSNFNELKDAAEEAQLQAQIGALKLGMTLDELGKIAALNADIADHIKFGGMPNVGLDDGLTKEQIKSREKLIGNADKNTDRLHDAIWGSAASMANSIVSALNIGGGGKGSNLGGALGGTAGFALGFAFGGGPVGGAIGSTIGNVAGSFLGGMFDHNTKALNANTQATRQNTAALLLNAPEGFRVASYRYGSSSTAPDIDAISAAQRRRQSRGGTTGRGNL